LSGVAHRDLKLDNVMLNFPNYTKSKKVSEEYMQTFLKTVEDADTEEEIEDFDVVIVDLGLACDFNKDNIL